MSEVDMARRFGGIGRLYGERALERFQQARVCVIGIGGVGSWIVEALARSGIGHLTLIDLDNVAESNVNRQIHALDGAFGLPKVTAMAQRVALIHPHCQVTECDTFIEEDNLAELLGGGFDMVVDAMDSVAVKAPVIAACRARGLPLVVCGAAGGKMDPTQVKIDDLARVTHDPIATKVRHTLRKQYDFPREGGKKFGVDWVFSPEPIVYPDRACDSAAHGQGLNCGGFGSAMCVTTTFGMFAASRVLRHLAATSI